MFLSNIEFRSKRQRRAHVALARAPGAPGAPEFESGGIQLRYGAFNTTEMVIQIEHVLAPYSWLIIWLVFDSHKHMD